MFGGVQNSNQLGFLPTGETIMFLLGGNDVEQRIQTINLFSPDGILAEKDLLKLDKKMATRYPYKGRLIVSRKIINELTNVKQLKTKKNNRLGGKKISTPLNWNDLVLNSDSMESLREIISWIEHGDTLLKNWGMEGKIQAGYRTLFHGPPGTGKTLAAKLLGKAANRKVYRISTQRLISKYIGETEKNITELFKRAKKNDWILFFDEADALFGKRSQVSSNERFANQEVGYLLQRIESYSGVIILSLDNAKNLDEAFSRRFQSIIHFPMPSQKERKQLWEQGFSSKVKLSKEIDIEKLSLEYEMTGGAINRVIRNVSIESIAAGNSQINMKGIVREIRKELSKTASKS